MDKFQTLFDTDDPHMPYVVALTGGLVFVSGMVIYKIFSRKGPSIPDGPPNTVVIHQYKRGPRVPSTSPFPVKLETFCRLAKIPCVASCKGIRGPKGKFPWMTYNGEVVADSQFCIDFLKKKLGVDPNKHLDAFHRGLSRHIQVLVDEHFFWTLVYFRWIHDKVHYPKLMKEHHKIPWYFIPLAKRNVWKQIYAQGMGRHSAEEIQKIMMDDLQALSDILGSKSYMLGEVMCEADCSAFGMLSQLVWHQEDKVMGNVLKDHFPNLQHYCYRIKETLWPDWDECCQN